MSLLMTGLFGLTIFLGMVLIFIKNNRLVELSISISFSVLLLLIFLELVPEALEHLKYLEVILYALIGMIVLKLLDFFIPEHNHSDSSNHISHIGLMTTIALVLHNIIEGMALYSTLENDLKMGMLLGLGVGLHNIPMGMVVGTTLKDNYSKFKIFIIGLLVSLSTFLGGVLIYLIGNVTFYALGVMTSLTLGMIIYITFFELLEHLSHQNKKNNIFGFIIGFIIFSVSLLFHSH